MAGGDIVMSMVSGGAPSFPCGGCGIYCEDLYGPDLDVVIAGFTDCGECFILSGGRSIQLTGFTGITGSFSAGSTPTPWSVVIGTVTVDLFATEDCSGPSEPATSDVTLVIGCLRPPDPPNFLVVTAQTDFGNIFEGVGLIDDVIVNGLSCPTSFAIIGTVTLSVPP